jgi:hypothetical protein
MTSRNLAEVLLKLLGVYWLVNAVVSVPGLVGPRMTELDQGWWLVAIQALAIVLYLALGAWLIANGARVARYLAPTDTGQDEPLTSKRVQAIGLSLLGAYLATAGAAGLAINAVNYFLLEGRETEWINDTFFSRELPSIAANAAYLIAGIGLFVGRSDLTRFWHWLRPLAHRGDRD